MIGSKAWVGLRVAKVSVPPLRCSVHTSPTAAGAVVGPAVVDAVPPAVVGGRVVLAAAVVLPPPAVVAVVVTAWPASWPASPVSSSSPHAVAPSASATNTVSPFPLMRTAVPLVGLVEDPYRPYSSRQLSRTIRTTSSAGTRSKISPTIFWLWGHVVSECG